MNGLVIIEISRVTVTLINLSLTATHRLETRARLKSGQKRMHGRVSAGVPFPLAFFLNVVDQPLNLARTCRHANRVGRARRTTSGLEPGYSNRRGSAL